MNPLSPLSIPIRWVGPGEPHFPSYQTQSAAGMDLHATLEQPVEIAPLQRKLIPTGISMALPPGYEAQIRPRSGLSLRHGLTVLNSPGTIDADYRGEIKVILINLGDQNYTVQPNERIAQMVVAPVCTVTWNPTHTLPPSSRQDSGFGSTGTE